MTFSMNIINKQDIIDLLLSLPAETDTLEFKRLGSDNNNRILQSIVAFTNTEGGKIIL